MSTNLDYRVAGFQVATTGRFWVAIREIVKFEAAGDVDGYMAFAEKYGNMIPDEADRLILKAREHVTNNYFLVDRLLPQREPSSTQSID